MSNIIRIKRGVTGGVVPTGLTFGELAVNITDKTLFVGGVTGNTIEILGGGGGAATVAGVASINGLTGALGITVAGNLTLSLTGFTGADGKTFRLYSKPFATVKGAMGAIAFGDSTLPFEGDGLDLNASNSFKFNFYTDLSVEMPANLKIGTVYGDSFIEFADGTTQSTAFKSSEIPVIRLATTSLTGVASFNSNDFGVSATGHVSLTGNVARTNVTNDFTAVQSFSNGISGQWISVGGATFSSTATFIGNISAPNIVTSVNGLTSAITITGDGSALFGSGNNTISARLASTSLTGVASYNTTDFTVSAAGSVNLKDVVRSINGATGAISNIAVTNNTNNFTAVQSFPNGISGQSIRIGSGATFGSSYIDFTAVNPTLYGYNTGGYLRLQSFGTLFTTQSVPSIILQDADADLGGEPSITINPHSVGGGTVTIGNSSLSTINLQGNSVNSGKMTVVRGLSAQSFLVAAGSTFSGRASFTVGLTTQSLNVAQGATFNARASFAVGLSTGNLTVTKGATFTDIVNSTTLRNYGEVFSYQVRKELNLAKTATHYYTDLRYGNTFFLSLVGSDNAGTFGGYAGGAAKPSIQVPFDGSCLLATTIGLTGATATTLTGSLTAGQFIFSPGLTDSGVTAFNIHGTSTVVLSKPATFTTNEFAIFINPPSEGLGMVASPHNLVASSKSPARVHSFTMLVNCTAGSSITWNSGLTSYGQIKWPSGTPPTITTTNGKMDVFSFLSYDHGVSWLAFNAGQNF